MSVRKLPEGISYTFPVTKLSLTEKELEDFANQVPFSVIEWNLKHNPKVLKRNT